MTISTPKGAKTDNCVPRYDEAYYRENGNNYRDRLEFRLANLWRAVYIRYGFDPTSVLDVGGGMGLLVERLQGWGVAAQGLELSRYAICQAPEAVRCCFVQGSLIELPYEDGAFDVVASVNVMEHMSPDEVSRAVAECARVARRGIYHEITVLEDVTVIHRDPTHQTKFTAPDWLELFRDRLPQWEAKRGLWFPRYKNGIFLLRRRQEG